MDSYRARRGYAAVVLVAACAAHPVSAAAAGLAQLQQGFTGQLIRYHKAHPTSKHITKVTLTRHGAWMETDPMFAPSRPGAYIQNFAQDRAWVIDTQKRIYAQLPREHPTDEPALAESEWSSYGGIMATQACRDATKAQLIRRKPDGEVWQCHYPGLIVEQLFDKRWTIVTREEWPDLTVIELRQLKAVDFGEHHFAPAKTYLEVSLQEFFQGYAPLPSYDSGQL